MKPTYAGQHRQVISIEQPTRTPDGFGETIVTWTTFAASVRAKVEPIVGRELTQASQVQADHTDRVTIRYREGIKPDMRIRHRGRTLNIVSMSDVEERTRRIEIICREQT